MSRLALPAEPELLALAAVLLALVADPATAAEAPAPRVARDGGSATGRIGARRTVRPPRAC